MEHNCEIIRAKLALAASSIPAELITTFGSYPLEFIEYNERKARVKYFFRVTEKFLAENPRIDDHAVVRIHGLGLIVVQWVPSGGLRKGWEVAVTLDVSALTGV